MVRLVDISPRYQDPVIYVSIPVWCDWWHGKGFYLLTVIVFQFQYGAIGGMEL